METKPAHYKASHSICDITRLRLRCKEFTFIMAIILHERCVKRCNVSLGVRYLARDVVIGRLEAARLFSCAQFFDSTTQASVFHHQRGHLNALLYHGPNLWDIS